MKLNRAPALSSWQNRVFMSLHATRGHFHAWCLGTRAMLGAAVTANNRKVRRLQVVKSSRQIDARECCSWRYLLLSSALLACIPAIQRLFGPGTGRPDVAPMLIAMFLVLIMLGLILQPWHQHLNIDLDTKECRVEWRLFGFWPAGRRTFEIEARSLAVVVIRPPSIATGSQSQNTLGCLLLLLPFPLSLIASAVMGSDSASSQPKPYCALVLNNHATGTREGLLRLASHSVADPLLGALNQCMPDHVEVEAHGE